MTRRGLLLLSFLLALTAGVFSPSPVRAQEGIRCTTTVAQSLINTGQSVFYSAGPSSTGNGNVIFFWSTGDLEGNGKNADGNIELFRSELRFNADGSVTRSFKQITNSTGSILGGFNLAPDVSADGRYLVFFSDRHYFGSGFDNTDGNFEIFVADLSDLNNPSLRQITNSTQGANLYPSISDDGRWIAFISDNALDPATAGSVSDAERNLEVYVADLSVTPTRFRQITQTPLGVLNDTPDLSGDGSTLVFASTQSLSNPEGNLEIFRYVLNSELMTAVTSTSGGTNEMPVVSQNGSQVAFVSDQRLDSTVNIVGGRQVFLSPNPATGTGFSQLSDTPGADNFDPNISADGNRVIYQRLDSTGSQWVVLYDGVAQSRQVFRSRTDPTRGEVGAPVLSGNGTVLFYEDEGGISTVECSISDLGLTANPGPANAIAGDSIVYVWTVSNLDQAIASGVQVQAALPSGLRLDTIEPASACSVNAQTVACAFSRLEIGESRTMTATVQTGVDALGDLTTQVVASSLTTVDRNPTNNTQSLTTSVSALADLGIAKSASPDTALQGEDIVYSLAISNTGPSLAHNVRVTDTLPAGIAFVSSDSCEALSGVLVCSLGDMLPGTWLTPTIRTRVAAFEELDIVNQAVVASALTTDPRPLNNSVSITNSVNTKFDLAISAAALPAPLAAGGPITYAYGVTNFGPSSAENVQISVTLPAEMAAIAPPQVEGAGSCTLGRMFTCDLGTLVRTQIVTVTVTGAVSPTVSGPITTTAHVRSLTEANADRNSDNDEISLTSVVVQQANLHVEKRASHSAAVAGTNITYTLDVTNFGPSVAPSVVLTDVLPADVAITGLATSLGNCTGSLVVSCTITGLLPQEHSTVTVTVRVNSGALGVITNTVSVGSNIFDADPINNSATVTTTITDEADLKLVKAASTNAVVAGQDSLFYILSIANYGPSLARSVLLTDTLPASLSYTSSLLPDSSACGHSGGVVTCALGDIPAGITQTVRIDVSADSAASGTLTNTATVASSALDRVADNSATATINASQLADLQVTKNALIANLNVGGTITYTVNLDNFGPSNATGVVISDILPGQLLAPTVTVNRGSYSQSSSLWTVGGIAAGQRLTMTVAGRLGAAASGQVITNTALLQTLDQTDPTPLNNGQVVTFTVPLNADVGLISSASALTPAVQSLVTFVLTATNNGPETASPVQVNALLPAQLTSVGEIASAGSYSATTGLWSVGSLSNGASAVLTVTARVIGSGTFTNTAIISAAQYDDNRGDNTSAIGLTVEPAADISLTNLASPSAPNVGDTLFFTVRVTNDGPDAVADVRVSDIPAAGSFITPAAGTTYSQTTGLWTIPSLGVGESTTLVISRALSLSGSVTNQAEIVAASLFDPDSTPGNGLGNGEDDQSSVVLTVPAASDLEVGMSASGGQLVGQDVLLPIQITNRGPDVATNIVVSETLPANLAFRTHFVQGAGTYLPATGVWTIPSLAVGEFTILNITARVEPGAAGQLLRDEIEGVRLDQYDPGRFSNSASVSFQVGGADLAITKSVDRASADVGGPVVYTVSVLNNGPSATTNVRITDSLPISLTGIISSTSAGAFGPNTPGSAGVWRIAELGVGASETLVLTGTVIPGTANQIITNTISSATSSVADGDTANNTAAIGFRVTSADLVLQKSTTITQPQEGDSFSFILNVTNLGPDTATGVVVTDTMATGITTTVAGAGYNIDTGRWDVGSISPGQSRSLILSVVPVAGVGGGLVIVDPIDGKSADQEDPTPAINSSARVTVTVVGADLALVKSASKTTPDVGETVSFTVTLTNPGPFATGAVVVTDTLPAGLTLVGSPTVSAGTVSMNGAGTVATWSHTSAPVGFTARLRITATVDSGTGGQSLVNRAAIVSAKQTDGSAMPDPNRVNNTATATVVSQATDLIVALVDSPDPVAAGETLTYSAVVTNSGSTAAAAPVVTFTLPSSVSLLSAASNCDTSGFPTLVCTSTSALAVNASRTFTAAVSNSAVTTLSASASVSTSTPETDTGNNSASASTDVDPATPAKLVITGSASQTAGSSQNLTITAYDSLGNLATGYAGDKALTFSGASTAPDGTLPSVEDKDAVAIAFGTATTVTFASGVASVSSGNGVLRLYAAETAEVAVTDGTISSSGSDNLTVVVGADAAVALAVGGASSETAGDSQDLTITAQDTYSNTATGYTGDKSLTFSGASTAPDGTIPTVTDKDGTAIGFGSSITLTFASGVAAASSGSNGSLTLYATETATVSASDGSIASTGAGDLPVTVGSGDATALVISGSATQTAGESQSLTITAQDAFSNTATSYTGSKTLTFSGATAAPDGTDPAVVNSSGVTVTFGSDTTLTFSSGVATASGGSNGEMTLYAAEAATVAVSDGTIGSTGAGNLAVTVASAASSRLVFTTQPSSSANAGGTFSQQPVVEVRDIFENVAGVSDEIVLAPFTNSSCSTAASGTLSGGGPLAASGGVAAFSTVSYNQVGTIRLQASDSTNSAVATACSGTVTVSAGLAGSLTVQTEPADSTAGAPLSTQPVVALRDNSGNIITSDSTSTVTAVVQNGPGGFHSSSSTSVAFSSGVASFSNLRLDTAGAYTLTFFTSAGAFTVTSASFAVSPGAVSKLALAGSASQVAGDTQNLTITAQDSAGNTVPGYTGSQSLTFSGAAAAPDGTLPSVSNSSGAAVNFGTPTAISFSNGVATVSGSSNGALRLVKVETAAVAITDTVNGIGTASGGGLAVVVTPGSAAKLVIGGSPTATAGITQTPTITAQDSVGNTATSYTGSRSLTFSGASSAANGAQPFVTNGSGTAINFGNTTSIIFSNGVATASGNSNGAMVLVKAETATISVTDNGGTNSAGGGDLAVTVSGNTAVKLAITGSATQTAGATQNLTITAKDIYSNTAASYTGSKTLTFSGASAAPNGSLPSVKSNGGAAISFGLPTTFTFSSGVATASGGNNGGLRLVQTGSALVSASDGTINSIGSGNLAVTVNPGTGTQLVIITEPDGAESQQFFVQPPVVELRDALGNRVTSDSSSLLTASVQSGPGTFHPNSVPQISFVAGVAEYTMLRLDIAGSYVLRFTQGGLTVDSASFEVTSSSISKFTITGSATQSVDSPQSVTITAKDSLGNTASAYSGSKSLIFALDTGTGTAPNGTNPTILDINNTPQAIGASTAITFVNGVATASLRLVRAESVVLSVSDGVASATGTDRLSVAVSAGAANNLAFGQQPGSPATAGLNFAPQPSVRLRDQFNNNTTGNNTVVLTAFTNSGCTTAAAGILGGGSGTPASSGVATFSGVNYTKAETIYLKATSGGLTAACSNAVAVSADVAAKLIIGGSATQTAGITQTLTITALDSFGNTATSYGGDRNLTFSGANSAPNGLPPTVADKTGSPIPFGTQTPITFSLGIATVSGSSNGALILRKAEVATVDVADGSINSTAGGGLTVTVSSAGPDNLIFTTQPSSGATAGAVFSQQPEVRIRDQFNNPTTSADTITLTPFTNAACTSAATGVLNGGSAVATSGAAAFSGLDYEKAETVYLKAADSTTGGVTTACSNSIVVGPAAAAKLVISGSGSQTAGTTQNLSISAQDNFGNLATSYDGAKTLVFSGASVALDGSEPTVKNNSGVATGFGTGTLIDFSSGNASVSAGNNGVMALYRAESATVSVTDTVNLIGSSGADDLAVIVSPTAHSAFAFGTVASPQTAGTQFNVSITAQDEFSNTVTSFVSPVSLTTNGGTITPTTSALFSGGLLTQPVTVTLAGAERIITATSGVITGASNSFAVNPGAASGATSTISASPTSITADGASTSTITVQLKDANGNDLTSGGAIVTLSETSGMLSSVTDNGDGSYTAILTSTTTVDVSTVTGTVGGSPIMDDVDVTFAPGAASGATSTISASPTSITADGMSTSVITVQLKDVNANNLTSGGATVTLSQTLGSLSSVTDNGDGIYTAILTSTTTAGVSTVTGTVGGSPITDDADVTFTPGALSKFAVTMSGGTTALSAVAKIAGATFNVRVTAQDANGNTVTSYTGNVSLTSNAFAGTVSANIGTGGFVDSISVTPTVVGSGDRTITTAQGGTTTTNASGTFAVNSAFAITKMATTNLVTAGQSITYTVRVTNTSGSTLSTVTLTDSLPVTVTGVTLSSSNWDSCMGSGVVVCTAGSLGVNANAILTVTGTVTPTALHNEQLVNNAQVSAADVSIVQIAQVTSTVQRSVALAITKSASPSPVLAGNQITYTVRIINDGPSDASGLVVTDTLPVSVTNPFSSTTGGALSCSGSISITCNLSTLSAGSSLTWTITGTVSASALNGSVITNTAGVKSAEVGIAQTALVTTTIQRSVALAITKSAYPSTVLAGQEITYTVRITNSGPSLASNVQLTDTLPTLSNVISSTTGGLICGGIGSLTCTLTSLAVDGSVTWTITGIVSANALSGSVITNTAGVKAAEVSVAQTALVTTTVQRSVALAITKSASPSPVLAASQITYTVRITNSGPSDASGLVVTDTLPVSVTNPISSTTGGVLNCSGSSSITCNLSTLSAGSSLTWTITGTVSASALNGSVITNTAGVKSAEVSIAQTALVTTTVQRSVALAITTSAYPSIVQAGSLITYTLRITNTGSNAATNLVVTDTLPLSVTNPISSTGGAMTCSGSSNLTCTVGSLGGGLGVTWTITGTVNAAAPNGLVITNTAGATSAEVSVAQTALVTTTVQRSVALAITKSAYPSIVQAGSLITYTLRITNTGFNAATNLVVTDTLPLSVTNPISSTTGGVPSCSGSSSITCNLSTLSAGSSLTWTITGTVSGNAPNGLVITNTAGVKATEVSVAQTALVTTTVQRSVALAITKSAYPSTVLAGNQITYTVRITNSGPNIASNLVVTDNLPALSNVISSTTGGVLSCSGSSSLTCNLPSLGVGSSLTWTITGTVSASALSGSVITNTAGVTATEVSIAQPALVTTTVNTLADLQITKSEVVTDTPVAGSTVTYTLSITNDGPSYARSVYITDTLPVSVSFGSVIGMTPSNFFGTAVTTTNTVSWMTDTLPTGSGLITFTGIITGSGELINSVVITSTTTDDTPDNNSVTTGGFNASGSSMATAMADLWLRARSASTAIALDEPAEFIFRAGNRGPREVVGATVVIQSDAEIAGRLLTDPIAICPRADSGIVCPLPLLMPGDEIDIAVTVPVAQQGSFASVWTIESSLFDPNPDDNFVEHRWLVGENEWRFFLPFLQSQTETERNRSDEVEIYLPAVSN